MSLDLAAVAQHGIGRGDYAALVLSGSVDLLGEVAGSATWSTARRFAFEDPRIASADCIARHAGSPFARWTGPMAATPGVCFVLTDAAHPTASELRSHGAIEFGHFVTLDRLTVEIMQSVRVQNFLERIRQWGGWVGTAQARSIALLGFGDQGKRLAVRFSNALGGCETLIVDADPERAAEARALGFTIITPDDRRLRNTPIVSTPLRRPAAFRAIISAARESGLPVLDNACPWEVHNERTEGGEFFARGMFSMTAAADRSLNAEGRCLSTRPGAHPFPAHIIRLDQRRIGAAKVPHLHAGQRVQISDGVDISEPSASDRLPALFASFKHAYVGLDGQSNQHDAALGVFAARNTLAQLWPDEVRALMPADHRAALGVNPFERLLARSITGRTLGAPYLSPIEQTTLGILARAFCDDSPIIEIGSALGGSALLMAAATERPSGGGRAIISIDPDGDTRPAMRTLFRHEGFADRLCIIEKISDEAVDDACDYLKGRRAIGLDANGRRILFPDSRIPNPSPGQPSISDDRAGLIFIDGLHTFEQSQRDFQNYAPLVRPGGVLLFHDFDARFAGVARTITQLAAHDQRFTPICIMDTIAVFRRR